MGPLGYDSPRGLESKHPVIETLVALLLLAAVVAGILAAVNEWHPRPEPVGDTPPAADVLDIPLPTHIDVGRETTAPADPWTRGYEPCEMEDSPGPCYWDAARHGDGAGRSFVVEAAGDPAENDDDTVIYDLAAHVRTLFDEADRTFITAS